MVYNVHSSVTRSTVIFFSRSFFAYLPNRIIESGECHNSLNFVHVCSYLAALTAFLCVVSTAAKPLLITFKQLHSAARTAKICDCCSLFCCYSAASAAILQHFLKPFCSAATALRVSYGCCHGPQLLQKAKFLHHNFHQHTCKLTNKKNCSHEEVPEVE